MRNLLVKPSGPDCNLACDYCFYLEKNELYPGNTRMDLLTAEEMISQAMASGEPVTFSWQGGEPTLMGLDFFRDVIQLQKKYGTGGQRVTNTVQTNGVELTEEWVDFFSRYNFLVGISLDGPRDLHDSFRKYPDGGGSYVDVMEAIELLEAGDVPFNILTVLNSRTVKQPKRILNFFLQNDLRHLQFIPAIEVKETAKGKELASFTPSPEEVGNFLDEVFEIWTGNFPPRFSVRYFESLVSVELGETPGYCKIDENCGSYLVVEHNGDVYPCDFYVERSWKLGNLKQTTLEEIEKREEFQNFARGKTDLPSECRDCDYLVYCHGGCQRYRDLPGGPEDRSYLCKAYRRFLSRNLDKVKRVARRIAGS
ncbi:MAG: anaerobic sulfatase maturase [Candidatus Acetothermia bacterium]